MEKFDLTVSIVTYFDNNYGDIELFKKFIVKNIIFYLHRRYFLKIPKFFICLI
jgi:hypothetical protein